MVDKETHTVMKELNKTERDTAIVNFIAENKL
jgi:hypothetical protein